MRKIVLCAVFLIFVVSLVGAQTRYRKEVRFPDISGYKTLKCDFHIHTVFSDFIRVFEKIRSYKGNARFSTWLYRVATNYCLDRLKANGKLSPWDFFDYRQLTPIPKKACPCKRGA